MRRGERREERREERSQLPGRLPPRRRLLHEFGSASYVPAGASLTSGSPPAAAAHCAQHVGSVAPEVCLRHLGIHSIFFFTSHVNVVSGKSTNLNSIVHGEEGGILHADDLVSVEVPFRGRALNCKGGIHHIC